MAAGDILTLKKSIAPCLIRYLYIIALVLIALMTVAGVARGVRAMNPPPAVTSTASTPGPDQPNAQTAPNRPGAFGPGSRGPGFRGPDFREPGFAMRGPGFGMMGRLAPPARGGLVILGALVRAAIALMILRVLAEIGLAILKIAEKP